MAYRSSDEEEVAYQELSLRPDTVRDSPRKYTNAERAEYIARDQYFEAAIRPVLLLCIRHSEAKDDEVRCSCQECLVDQDQQYETAELCGFISYIRTSRTSGICWVQ